jgi:hypothetical protein
MRLFNAFTDLDSAKDEISPATPIKLSCCAFDVA